MDKLDQNVITGIIRRAVADCIGIRQESRMAAKEPLDIYTSAATHALKEEIVRVGQKLWERQYVEGNGGNISVRVSPQYVLCTPTLCSKRDVVVEDLSLIDLNNRQICGDREPSSEMLLHLEIYKAVPAAKAVIHCHPPHATAYAIAGVIPQGNLLPEQEVFVGPVALAPYETPGSLAFARTVLPYVKDHNTILLANHGIVCWADTVTHAEWYVEVVDTYCKTIMIASQLQSKLNEIPPDKIADLLARKKKMGLPDPRLTSVGNAADADFPSQEVTETERKNFTVKSSRQFNLDDLVNKMTAEMMAFLNEME